MVPATIPESYCILYVIPLILKWRCEFKELYILPLHTYILIDCLV
jgi:hypothetical protein